jgi:hypothetical protein
VLCLRTQSSPVHCTSVHYLGLQKFPLNMVSDTLVEKTDMYINRSSKGQLVLRVSTEVNFFVLLKFELRASHLLGMHSAT